MTNTLQVLTWTGIGTPPLYPPITKNEDPDSPYELYPYGFTQADIDKGTTHELSRLAAKQGRDRVVQWLFFERPAWHVDQAVNRMYFVPDEAMLGRVAYFTESGAWKGMWFRFGYDPRKDRLARYFQTLHWDLPQSVRVPALLSKLREGLLPLAEAEAKARNRSLVWILHYICIPLRMDGCEIRLRNCWVLLDIRRKIIRKALDEGIGMVEVMTPRYGFLEGGFLDMIRDVLMKEVVDLIRDLGNGGGELPPRIRNGDAAIHPLSVWLEPGKLRPLKWTTNESREWTIRPPPRVGLCLDFEPSQAFVKHVAKTGILGVSEDADIRKEFEERQDARIRQWSDEEAALKETLEYGVFNDDGVREKVVKVVPIRQPTNGSKESRNKKTEKQPIAKRAKVVKSDGIVRRDNEDDDESESDDNDDDVVVVDNSDSVVVSDDDDVVIDDV